VYSDIGPETVFACSACSASHRKNHQKIRLLAFLKEEKICYKMVYYIKPIVRNCVAKFEFMMD